MDHRLAPGAGQGREGRLRPPDLQLPQPLEAAETLHDLLERLDPVSEASSLFVALVLGQPGEPCPQARQRPALEQAIELRRASDDALGEGGALARLIPYLTCRGRLTEAAGAAEQAIAVLERAKEKFEFPVKWGVDLQSEHERYLTEKHAKKPVIVMNYPKDIKAFYMRVNDDGRTVAAMDVLAPGIGEIIGGSQREERLEMLDARMAERSIDKEHYGWYRDLRRYGTVPHAGFGLGFERTLAYVTGLSNVRDAIPFPRTPGNARY